MKSFIDFQNKKAMDTPTALNLPLIKIALAILR